jgi:hypothetical protein
MQAPAATRHPSFVKRMPQQQFRARHDPGSVQADTSVWRSRDSSGCSRATGVAARPRAKGGRLQVRRHGVTSVTRAPVVNGYGS